ncbi:MAG: glycosyltransferase [Lachnospiraceae bacterium]|nr:glycosyltransferase [Lachnospiraceae bacterium]
MKKTNFEKGLISVIIPTYNRRNTIVRAVESVLKQTYSNIEVIVVDDGSKDGTDHVVKDIKDERLKYVELDHNRGANYARNVGMKLASGKYIAFQDSDDVWLGEKLEYQIDYIERTGLKAVFCPYYSIIDNHEKELVPSKKKYPYDSLEDNLSSILKKTNVIGTQTILMDRCVMEDVGLFDEELSKFQDYEFVIRLSQKYKIGFVGTPLVDIYLQPDSITKNTDLEWDAYVRILRKHKDYLDIERFLNLFCGKGFLFDEKGINNERMNLLSEIIGERANEIVLDCFAKELFQYRESEKYRYKNFEKELHSKGFYIYGAGKKGREARRNLKKQGLIPKSFVVSNQMEIYGDIEGIPVNSIDSILEDNPRIIIAVTWELRDVFIENLLKKGFTDYCIYPF